MDYKQIKPFTNWKNNPTNNEDGSINYTACDMEDMALMIAWEKLLKYNMKHELAEEKKKVKHNNAAHDGHDTSKALTMASALVVEIAKIGNHKHEQPAPARAPEKREKKHKMAKINPDESKQREIWEKSQVDREKHNKNWTRKEFLPRTPGTYGPQQKHEPY